MCLKALNLKHIQDSILLNLNFSVTYPIFIYVWKKKKEKEGERKLYDMK